MFYREFKKWKHDFSVYWWRWGLGFEFQRSLYYYRVHIAVFIGPLTLRFYRYNMDRYLEYQQKVENQPKPWQLVLRDFTQSILHGSDEHRQWLIDACEARCRNKNPPPVRG